MKFSCLHYSTLGSLTWYLVGANRVLQLTLRVPDVLGFGACEACLFCFLAADLFLIYRTQSEFRTSEAPELSKRTGQLTTWK